MLSLFYLEEEENQSKESINKYISIFQSYKDNIPTLEEALLEMYLSSNCTKVEASDLINDVLTKSKEKLDFNKKEINYKYPNLDDEDILIIASYTCETNYNNFSPYKILNANLVMKNRENGIKKISKYLFIFLKSLRKLPRYYPKQDNRNLYRCIDKQVNYMIDPFNLESRSYIKGQIKTFWGFTSTSPNITTSYNFLGKKIDLKSGTIFTIYGNVWGYDITLFNYYNEEEILLEPERKFIVEEIYPPLNNIIHIRCKVEDSPLVLDEDNIDEKYKISTSLKEKNFSKQDILNKYANNEIIKCQKGKNHEFSKISGRCKNCSIIGCEKGLIHHDFNKNSGKCKFCNIIGCEKDLIEHEFNKISGKCKYCNILGCSNHLQDHNFNIISGKCKFCQIIGCSNGLIEHNFNKNSGKCSYCQILGCKNGYIEHNFNKFDGKCAYCQIIGCENGLKAHNFSKYSTKCNFCNFDNS